MDKPPIKSDASNATVVADVADVVVEAKIVEPIIQPCPVCKKTGLTEETYPEHFHTCTTHLRKARLKQVTENPTEEDLKHQRRENRKPYVPSEHLLKIK